MRYSNTKQTNIGGTKMKFNQWTLGLAALGVVSLASVAKAEEKMSAVQAAMSSTTISGYVDTSLQWNPGTGTGVNYYKFSEGKSDGFNLNVVQLTIAKPLDEAEWSAGYRADLWFGPDANTLNTQSSGPGTGSDFAIRQAYVALRMPVGNGLDWKMGVFDSIIGYESVESGNDPNFTRSYGHSIEPQTMTGLLATYHFNDMISASAGIADTIGSTINGRANQPSGVASDGYQAESFKTYMASIALTAPDSMGFLKGSTLYFGVVNGFAMSSGFADTPLANGPGNQTSWYVGATMATPVEGLKLGIAYDYLDSHRGSGPETGSDIWAASIYASYQATEKLSFHVRGELATGLDSSVFGLDANENLVAQTDNTQIWSLTGTVQYDLWKNVISRLEVRWDWGDEGQYFFATSNGVGDDRRNTFLVAANVIYKF
jgi:hypothetical protein